MIFYNLFLNEKSESFWKVVKYIGDGITYHS